MQKALLPTLGALFLSLSSNVSVGQEVLVQRYNVFVQRNKHSFFTKTIKELSTPEGRVIISAAAAYFGVDASTINAAIATTADLVVPNNQQDNNGFIRSPQGYTICYAKPSNENMGAGQHGIETHGDSTFNTSLMRAVPGKNQDDGLGWYIVVPTRRSTDTRVAGSFDITFVKAEPGWRQRYPKCRPSGEHPWLARNNSTTLNVKCTVPGNCE